MSTQRDYLTEAGSIARGRSILLAERAHVAALVEQIGGALNELINLLIDYEDSGQLDENGEAILERARVVWHRMEGLPYPPAERPEERDLRLWDEAKASDFANLSDDMIAAMFERHREADPHCTCNDCIEWASREAIEGGRDEDR
jgi:hypothetical protein